MTTRTNMTDTLGPEELWTTTGGGGVLGSLGFESPRIENKGTLLSFTLYYIGHSILHRALYITSGGNNVCCIRHPLRAEDTAGLAKSSVSCLGTPGSKQRRQRASYIPAAPTTIKSSDSTRRWVCLAGLPQRMQIASVLVIDSAKHSNSGI